MLKARSGEVEAIDPEGALVDERAMDLLGADELEPGFAPCGGIGRKHEKEFAVSAVEADHAEFNDERAFHPWWHECSKGQRQASRHPGAGRCGERLASRAKIADRHGAEFAIAVAVLFQRGVVGRANPQRVGFKQEHRNGIAAKEKVAKIGG